MKSLSFTRLSFTSSRRKWHLPHPARGPICGGINQSDGVVVPLFYRDDLRCMYYIHTTAFRPDAEGGLPTCLAKPDPGGGGRSGRR